jgi:biotin operon repressor
MTVNSHDFLILASERLADIGTPLEELDRTLAASRAVVESVLHRLADQGPDMFSQVEGVCLHDGHMLILLADLIDSEEQLSRWVSAATAIKSRPRVRDGALEMA